MHKTSEADLEIRDCIDKRESFVVVAGAGSGKTSSLVQAMKYIERGFRSALIQNNQKVVCITYTNRARDELVRRMNDDDLFEISTIHSFLWNEVGRFTRDIACLIKDEILPEKIRSCSEKINGGYKDMDKVKLEFEECKKIELEVGNIEKFVYDDGGFSDFGKGRIGHDDAINISTRLILSKKLLRMILGHKYPFIFVDEAQDASRSVVTALNEVARSNNDMVVGYFGDPMQQIYDNGIGTLEGPDGYRTITKSENYRSATEIVNLANKFREDLKQKSCDVAAKLKGKVKLNLVQAEEPSGNRKRYSDEQLDRAWAKYEKVMEYIGWSNNQNSKSLFLTRQMIARRLGFTGLNTLFNSKYASQRTKREFESGSHFLLAPLLQSIWPLVSAVNTGKEIEAFRLLQAHSPIFRVGNHDDRRSLRDVISLAKQHFKCLHELWKDGTVKEVLEYALEQRICRVSEQLAKHLERDPRNEVFDGEIHRTEEIDWLVDEYLRKDTKEIEAYANFLDDKSPFSTQHGVKGEEYDNVLVFFDDVEAGWNKYSSSKLFLPNISGKATVGQLERTRRLAYVCVTRAKINLDIVLFCIRPADAKQEILAGGMFNESQIQVIPLMGEY